MRTLVILAAFAALIMPARAADPVLFVPPEVAASPVDQDGVWGAIAIAPPAGRYGFFWGGASRTEAEANALDHCETGEQPSCSVASVFRSSSRNGGRDASGLPNKSCGALAVPRNGETGRWATVSASSRREAETEALDRCGGERSCRIQEWVCT